MTVRKFEEMNLYSNKTLEKLMTSLVNESANAVLVNVFEDAALLLDHKEGQFYLADYTFDHKKATFTFENFEQIDLRKDAVDFKGDARNFFESEDMSILALAESYKENVSGQDEFISDLITESMMEKDFGSVVDYSVLKGLNESSILEESFFKTYKERTITHPTGSIKMFNWKDPVRVSLVETEGGKIFNKATLKNADSLWKNEEFKGKFHEASKVFIEDVEAGKEKLQAIFEEYPQLFKLDSADRKTLFGKTIISNPELRESRTDILKGIDKLLAEDAFVSIKDKYIVEAEEEAEVKDVPPEVSPADVSKIAEELRKLCSKIDDEKVCEKLTELADKLDSSKDGAVEPEDVKEAVEILSL